MSARFVDTLDPMVTDLLRNFNLITDLETRSEQLFEQINRAYQQFKDIDDKEQRVGLFKQIMDSCNLGGDYCDDKIRLAQQTYDMIDRQIQKLDAELGKLNTEYMLRSNSTNTIQHQQPPPPSSAATNKNMVINGVAASNNGGDSPVLTIKEETGGSSTPPPLSLSTTDRISSPSAANKTGQSLVTSAKGKAKRAKRSKRDHSRRQPNIIQTTLDTPTPSTTPSSSMTLSSTPTKSVRGPSSSASSSAKSASQLPGDDNNSDSKVLSGLGKAHGTANANMRSLNDETVGPVEPALAVDMPVDPNEPVYCICHQVSHGQMIACEHSHCPIEWFHFACVNLTSPPKGNWFCENCKPKNRGRRKSRPKW